MNPKIWPTGKLWYIGIEDLIPTDIIIAKLLDIEYDLYVGILKKHGAHLDDTNDTNGEYWFNTKKEVEMVISELEPYYILTKLLK